MHVLLITLSLLTAPCWQAEGYDKEIAKIREKESGLHRDKTSLLTSKIQMEAFDNPKYKLLLADVTEQLRVIEHTLQTLREARIALKNSTEQCNRFTNEGMISALWSIFQRTHIVPQAFIRATCRTSAAER